MSDVLMTANDPLLKSAKLGLRSEGGRTAPSKTA